MGLEEEIKQIGLEIGFDKVAIARAEKYPEHAALQEWLAQGFHGGMEYMARGAERRINPKEVWPQARSVITCALNYNTDHPYSVECVEPGQSSENKSKGWIARYAWGEDYHEVMESLLARLEAAIVEKVAATFPTVDGNVAATFLKKYTDTGPVMERVFAKNSGIGWIGKNTCVIDPKLGSWLFLGVIITSLELKPDPIIPDHCGTCTACIDACPTQAIVAPHTLDARRCISYLTIEHRGEIAPELAEKMGNHIFGCDICQDVCPWNKKAPKTASKAFQPRDGFFNPGLTEFRKKVENEYPQGFKNSPLKRAKKEGLLRNIDIAQKNITLNATPAAGDAASPAEYGSKRTKKTIGPIFPKGL